MNPGAPAGVTQGKLVLGEDRAAYMPALQWAPVGLHLQEGLWDGYCCDVSSERAHCWLHSCCMSVIFLAFGWTLARCLPAGRCVSAGCFVFSEQTAAACSSDPLSAAAL